MYVAQAEDRQEAVEAIGTIVFERALVALLLAFPENVKYRAKPGLIHPGNIVRVK